MPKMITFKPDNEIINILSDLPKSTNKSAWIRDVIKEHKPKCPLK